MPVEDDLISIGELAARSGIKIETIRYYERQGQLPRAGRTAGGHRLFDRDHLERLLFIKRARSLGIGGGDFQRLVGLLDSGYTCGEVQRIAEKHLGGVRRRIEELKEIEATLLDLLSDCGKQGAKSCAIIERLSAQVLSGGGK